MEGLERACLFVTQEDVLCSMMLSKNISKSPSLAEKPRVVLGSLLSAYRTWNLYAEDPLEICSSHCHDAVHEAAVFCYVVAMHCAFDFMKLDRYT